MRLKFFSPLSSMLTVAVLATLTFAGITLPVVALAQEIAAQSESALTVGDLIAPWLQTVLALVGFALTALIAWIAALVKSRTGFEIESKHRDTLQVALLNGAGFILDAFAEKLHSKDVAIRNQAIREAVRYVNENAADAVKYFMLDNNDLTSKVHAKLGLALAGEKVVGTVINNLK